MKFGPEDNLLALNENNALLNSMQETFMYYNSVVNNYVFYIGTSAELIKLIPVIKQFNSENISYRIFASGQTNLKEEELSPLLFVKVNKKISSKPIKSSMLSFALWSLMCFFKTVPIFLKETISALNSSKKFIVIVHGDTVSSVIGSVAGKLCGAQVLHVESGLRSFNFSEPFPEEICRFVTSKLAHVHFCPNQWSVNNLKKNRGIKINTFQNTSLESIKCGLLLNATPKKITERPYFLLIIHRQENILFKKDLTIKIIEHVNTICTKNLKCVFVMHKLTENFLIEHNLYDKVKNNPNIILLPRTAYLDFIHVINSSEFLLTDGGSNQEETYYLGKPALVLRNVTERIEGLGENVKLMKSDFGVFKSFIENYQSFIRLPIELPNDTETPSSIILKNIKLKYE